MNNTTIQLPFTKTFEESVKHLFFMQEAGTFSFNTLYGPFTFTLKGDEGINRMYRIFAEYYTFLAESNENRK